MSLTEKAAEHLLDYAIKKGWFEKLRAIGKKRKNILILGASGCGKSNLIQSITRETPEIIHYLNRTEYAKKNKISISNTPFNLIDTPGQKHHKRRRISEIRSALGSGLSGIINVVSYGYHENKLGIKNAFTNGDQINPQYLEDHRKFELELLQEWNVMLGVPEIGKSLITVISKADLWWNDEEEIYKHYVEGEYFQNLKNAQSLNPATIHYSSVFHKFYGKGSLSGTFDEGDQINSKLNFLSTLLASIENGKYKS